MAIKMPRDGAIIFADLIGKLDLIRVACADAMATFRARWQAI
jgi:hypothetical protein